MEKENEKVLDCDQILNKVSQEFKQKDYEYALNNCLVSYLKEIARLAMHDYAAQQTATHSKRIQELESQLSESQREVAAAKVKYDELINQCKLFVEILETDKHPNNLKNNPRN